MSQQIQDPSPHILPEGVSQLRSGEMGLMIPQTQLGQTVARLHRDTLSSHHQTTGTSKHLSLLLPLTHSETPFQCLQPAPFCVFEISG